MKYTLKLLSFGSQYRFNVRKFSAAVNISTRPHLWSIIVIIFSNIVIVKWHNFINNSKYNLQYTQMKQATKKISAKLVSLLRWRKVFSIKYSLNCRLRTCNTKMPFRNLLAADQYSCISQFGNSRKPIVGLPSLFLFLQPSCSPSSTAQVFVNCSGSLHFSPVSEIVL